MIRLRAWIERIRSSMFFVPVVLVGVAVALSIVSTTVDVRIFSDRVPLPDLLVSTVDSARALLGVIASATIAFAGISVSISLLLIQLASSQFSPRVLYGFFRDPVTKWVTGLVIGTFTYCLLVLRLVRGPGETDVPQIVPHISVIVATFLGVVSIVAVVGLISHSARSMQVSRIIRRITDEGRELIGSLEDRSSTPPAEPTMTVTDDLPERGYVVHSEGEGWVQLIDGDRLLAALAPRTVCRLRVFVGGFVPDGSPLCELHPAPEGEAGEDVVRDVRRAIRLGRTRTMQQDVAFAFRQLVDIALRALSPGINDPTTAQEASVHVGSLLAQLLRVGIAGAELRDDEGRQVLRPHDPGPDDYVNLAFDQIRRASTSEPAVAITILEVIGATVASVERAGTTEGLEALRRQARLVLAGVEASDALPADVSAVAEAARTRQLV